MVPADVWQKQLSATNAEALHTGPGQLPAPPPPLPSTPPHSGDGRQLLLDLIVRHAFFSFSCFFFLFFTPAGINDANNASADVKTLCRKLPSVAAA